MKFYYIGNKTFETDFSWLKYLPFNSGHVEFIWEDTSIMILYIL